MGTELTMPTNRNAPAPAPSIQEIARRGEAIYAEKFQKELERTSSGKFVAININNADATVADTGEQAVEEALLKDPTGFFHLMRVGRQSAYEAGWYVTYAH
jgi:hypothetical protein